MVTYKTKLERWYTEELEFSKPIYIIIPSQNKISLTSTQLDELKNSEAFLIINEQYETVKWENIKNIVIPLLKDVPIENVVIVSLVAGFNLKNNSFIKDDCPYKIFHKNIFYDSYYDNFYNTDTEPKQILKHYACLMGNDKISRRYIFYMLKKGNLLPFGYVSHHRYQRPNSIDDNMFLTTLKSKIKDFDDFLRESEETVSLQDPAGWRHWVDKPDIYNEQSCISLTCESVLGVGGVSVTEKTLRSIIFKKPFLLVAEPYVLKYLKHLGFKTFSDVFDESYDNILCPVIRCQKVYQQLESFCKLSLNEAIDLTEKLRYITDYNYDYYFNHFDGTFKFKEKIESYFLKVHKGELNGRN